MRGLIRYLCAAAAMLLLLCAGLLGLFGAATTETFALHAIREDTLRKQQEQIDAAAAALTAQWQLSPEVLASVSHDAGSRHSAAVAAWWHGLWHDSEADPAMPVFLDAQQERELIAAIMADEGFIAATAEDQRRAIARDDVAYALDEAACDAVTPLRRSIIDAGVTMAAGRLDLPLLRKAVLLAAAAAAGLALVCLLLAHRAAGGTLLATAAAMLLASVPVWLIDLPGLLAMLNPLASQQAADTLLLAAMLWYGAAAALAVVGWLILALKRIVRRVRR